MYPISKHFTFFKTFFDAVTGEYGTGIDRGGSARNETAKGIVYELCSKINRLRAALSWKQKELDEVNASSQSHLIECQHKMRVMEDNLATVRLAAQEARAQSAFNFNHLTECQGKILALEDELATAHVAAQEAHAHSDSHFGLESSLVKAEEKINELEDELNRVRCAEDVAEDNKRRAPSKKTLVKTKRSLAIARGRQRDARQTIEEITNEMERLTEVAIQANEFKTHLVSHCRKLQNDIHNLEDQLAVARSEVTNQRMMRRKIEDLSDSLNAASEATSSLESELQETKERLEETKGYLEETLSQLVDAEARIVIVRKKYVSEQRQAVEFAFANTEIREQVKGLKQERETLAMALASVQKRADDAERCAAVTKAHNTALETELAKALKKIEELLRKEKAQDEENAKSRQALQDQQVSHTAEVNALKVQVKAQRKSQATLAKPEKVIDHTASEGENVNRNGQAGKPRHSERKCPPPSQSPGSAAASSPPLISPPSVADSPAPAPAPASFAIEPSTTTSTSSDRPRLRVTLANGWKRAINVRVRSAAAEREGLPRPGSSSAPPRVYSRHNSGSRGNAGSHSGSDTVSGPDTSKLGKNTCNGRRF